MSLVLIGGDSPHLTTLVLSFCSWQAGREESFQLDQNREVCAFQFLLRGAKTESPSFQRKRDIIFCS